MKYCSEGFPPVTFLNTDVQGRVLLCWTHFKEDLFQTEIISCCQKSKSLQKGMIIHFLVHLFIAQCIEFCVLEKWWDKQTLTAASFYNNNSNMASSEKWNASMFWKCRDISEVWLSALTLVPCCLGCSPLSSLKRRKHLAFTMIQTSFHSLCVHLPQILLEGIALWIYLFYCT